jgi:hypothetical protein
VELVTLEQWLVRMMNLKEFRVDRLGIYLYIRIYICIYIYIYIYVYIYIHICIYTYIYIHIYIYIGMAMRLSLEQKRSTGGAALERLVKVLKDDVRRLNERIRVGQFIFEKLASAPWNTTDAFVRSTVEKDGLGQMELQVGYALMHTYLYIYIYTCVYIYIYIYIYLYIYIYIHKYLFIYIYDSAGHRRPQW